MAIKLAVDVYLQVMIAKGCVPEVRPATLATWADRLIFALSIANQLTCLSVYIVDSCILGITTYLCMNTTQCVTRMDGFGERHFYYPPRPPICQKQTDSPIGSKTTSIRSGRSDNPRVGKLCSPHTESWISCYLKIHRAIQIANLPLQLLTHCELFNYRYLSF